MDEFRILNISTSGHTDQGLKVRYKIEAVKRTTFCMVDLGLYVKVDSMKVRERGNRKENCKITKMLLDVVTFSRKIISNIIKRRSVENVDKVI